MIAEKIKTGIAKLRMAAPRLMRYVVYKNIIVTLVRDKILQLILPPLTATYYLCLDIFGDKWSIIKDHPDEHKNIFIALVSSSLMVLLVRGIADHYDDKAKERHNSFVHNLALLTSKLVETKLKRFKSAAEKLKPGGNTFRLITQPDQQIGIILTEIHDLLRHSFGIQNDQVFITIMHLDPNTATWYYKYRTNNQWNNTKAEVVLSKKSAAAECLRTGEPLFYPDKLHAATQEKYHLSDRDNRMSGGSVFCYPATTKNPDYDDNFIISIVTYGKCLCNYLDDESTMAIKRILIDLCKRIDLELTLDSIKYWQFTYHTSSTRNGQ